MTTISTAEDLHILTPNKDIRRDLDFAKQINDPNAEDFYDKKFDYATAKSLLKQGYRVARPVGDVGYMVLSMSENTKGITSFYSDGNTCIMSTTWDQKDEHIKALDWTLADHPQTSNTTIPSYKDQPEVLQDFLFEHIEDPIEQNLAQEFFQLACNIAYNNDEGHGKRVALDHLFNAKTVILHDMQKRRLRAIEEAK